MTTGILLINLGTPDVANKTAVKRYLRQFLNDKRVIDLPYLARKILSNLIIIPFRTKTSLQAYQSIWQETGSPLLLHSQALQQALSEALGEHYHVALGMRYGNPSLTSAYQQLQHCTKIIAIPLFPQYSSAATGSAMAALLELMAKQWNIPQLIIVNQFYDNPHFIKAYAQRIKTSIDNVNPEVVLFSYHGLPQRHIDKSGCQQQCHQPQCCPSITAANAYCYRAQCYATSQLLANALQWQAARYYTCFQSRLGKLPWIKPYTDELLLQLSQEGVRNLVVACPSFVADCLETLEEINIRARQQWQHYGGKRFEVVPCLNADQQWVNALTHIISSHKDD